MSERYKCAHGVCEKHPGQPLWEDAGDVPSVLLCPLCELAALTDENQRLRGELGQAWDHCVTVCGEREARLRHETWAREQAEARTRDLEAERTLAVKARDNWREAHDQVQARTRALEAAIEGNTFCECFDEYGRKRPTPCWRCAALTEPPPPAGGQG